MRDACLLCSASGLALGSRAVGLCAPRSCLCLGPHRTWAVGQRAERRRAGRQPAGLPACRPGKQPAGRPAPPPLRCRPMTPPRRAGPGRGEDTPLVNPHAWKSGRGRCGLTRVRPRALGCFHFACSNLRWCSHGSDRVGLSAAGGLVLALARGAARPEHLRSRRGRQKSRERARGPRPIHIVSIRVAGESPGQETRGLLCVRGNFAPQNQESAQVKPRTVQSPTPCVGRSNWAVAGSPPQARHGGGSG